MTEKLFPWLLDPLFSSGILTLRSDSRIKRQINIGPASDGGEIACYRVDLEFGNQEKTYLFSSSDPGGLAVTYEKALEESYAEGYLAEGKPDRPKADDVKLALDARDS